MMRQKLEARLLRGVTYLGSIFTMAVLGIGVGYIVINGGPHRARVLFAWQ